MVQTEETISVLKEENTQLQLTVNQLLERVQVLEAMVTVLGTTVNSTSDSLQGESTNNIRIITEFSLANIS